MMRIMPYGPVPSGGFTLVEVMVAMVVLSIGLLGMVGMMGVAIKANGYSGKDEPCHTIGARKA